LAHLHFKLPPGGDVETAPVSRATLKPTDALLVHPRFLLTAGSAATRDSPSFARNIPERQPPRYSHLYAKNFLVRTSDR
jgi:hypothetical protein